MRDTGPDWVPETGERTLISEHLVEKCRKHFEAGEDWALLEAIDVCARSGQRLPMWIVDAFCPRYAAWLTYEAGTLDAAFGVARPKRTKIKARAARERQRARVVRRVFDLHRAGVPIDERLFARAGKALGLSGGAAKSIYYEDESKPLLKLFELEQKSEILRKARNK
jgi:hypothetical protein